MKKISEMYRLSGGSDYQHTCSECISCRKEKNVHRCRLYEEAGGKGPWKPYFISCQFFGVHEKDRATGRSDGRSHADGHI